MQAPDAVADVTDQSAVMLVTLKQECLTLHRQSAGAYKHAGHEFTSVQFKMIYLDVETAFQSIPC